MSKAKVLVIGAVPEVGLAPLHEHFQVDRVQTDLGRERILEVLADYEAVIPRSTRVDQEFIDAGLNLKIISNFGMGYDKVDTDYARSKGIVVTNTPRAVQVPTAETTMSLILATVKRHAYYNRIIRQGDWVDVGQPEHAHGSLQGSTVGIVGFGGIGKEVARMLQPFDVEILYYQRNEDPVASDYQATYANFEQLLKASDIVTLHVPYNESTHHLIDQEALSLMKESAILINMARGAVVDESALVLQLQAGKLAGAGLDVYEHEPKVSSELLDMDQVVLLPHIGTGSLQARTNMALEASRNIINYLIDGQATNQVN